MPFPTRKIIAVMLAPSHDILLISSLMLFSVLSFLFCAAGAAREIWQKLKSPYKFVCFHGMLKPIISYLTNRRFCSGIYRFSPFPSYEGARTSLSVYTLWIHNECYRALRRNIFVNESILLPFRLPLLRASVCAWCLPKKKTHTKARRAIWNRFGVLLLLDENILPSVGRELLFRRSFKSLWEIASFPRWIA